MDSGCETDLGDAAAGKARSVIAEMSPAALVWTSTMDWAKVASKGDAVAEADAGAELELVTVVDAELEVDAVVVVDAELETDAVVVVDGDALTDSVDVVEAP